jgi:tetratricopeptide (TPR) repeat protein
MDLLQSNSPEAALNHAKKSVESDKTNPWYQQLLGDCHMAMGKYDAAVKAYREVSIINPDDPNILYQLASSQLYAGKKSDAIATYDLLEKKTGPYEELSLQKHQLYLELKDNVKAGNELEKLAGAYPEEPRYWGMAAQFYQSIGNQEKAELALQEMVKADPANGMVHFQLSEYYAAKGDDSKSYDELKLAFESVDVRIDLKIGVLARYLQLTDYKKEFLPQAYDLLQIARRLHPNDAVIYAMSGDYYYRDGKKAEALIEYQKSLALDQSRKLIWEQVLVIESEIDDYSSMVKDSETATSVFPTMPEFYYYNGFAHQKQLNYSKAIEAFNLGKELVVDNDILLIRIYSSLGDCYHYTEQHEKSDEAYEAALKLDPQNVFVLNNYAYYLSLRKIKLDKAAAMSARTNEISPDTPSFEDTYGWILFQQGKYTEALTWVQRAISHSEPNGELLEHLGDIYFMLGKTSEAIQNWREAARLGGAGKNIEQKILQQKIIE